MQGGPKSDNTSMIVDDSGVCLFVLLMINGWRRRQERVAADQAGHTEHLASNLSQLFGQFSGAEKQCMVHNTQNAVFSLYGPP